MSVPGLKGAFEKSNGAWNHRKNQFPRATARMASICQVVDTNVVQIDVMASDVTSGGTSGRWRGICKFLTNSGRDGAGNVGSDKEGKEGKGGKETLLLNSGVSSDDFAGAASCDGSSGAGKSFHEYANKGGWLSLHTVIADRDTKALVVPTTVVTITRRTTRAEIQDVVVVAVLMVILGNLPLELGVDI